MDILSTNLNDLPNILTNHYCSYVLVFQIRIVRDFMKRPKGFCYVEFDTPENAQTAVNAVHDIELNERQIRVSLKLCTEKKKQKQ